MHLFILRFSMIAVSNNGGAKKKSHLQIARWTKQARVFRAWDANKKCKKIYFG